MFQIKKWFSDHTSDQNWLKNVKNTIFFFALTGNPTADKSTTNSSNFIKWFWIRFLVLKMQFPDHKFVPDHKKLPGLAKRPQKYLKNFTFCSDSSSNSWYISNQPLYFHYMILSMYGF